MEIKFYGQKQRGNPALPGFERKRKKLAKFLIDKCYFDSPPKFGDFYLVQIGRRFCEAGGGAEEHLHKNWYELTVVTDGKADIITNGKKTEVKKGDIYLSFPCDVHEIISSAREPLKYDFFSFYTDNEKYGELLSKLSLICPADSRVFRDGHIPALISDAMSELSGDAPFSEEILASVFGQIVIYTLRNTLYGKTARTVMSVSGAEMLCYQIMNYIDTNIFTMSNLEDISAALKYNYAYLSGLFKKTTGNTVLSYYQRKKLEAARLILLEENTKIGEVSERLGYASPYSFSRAFKEAYGISPKQYSKRRSSN